MHRMVNIRASPKRGLPLPGKAENRNQIDSRSKGKTLFGQMVNGPMWFPG